MVRYRVTPSPFSRPSHRNVWRRPSSWSGKWHAPIRRWCGAFMTRATLSPTTPKTTPFAKCLWIRRRARSKGGFESLRNAIGDSQAVSPFFRNPGLLRQKSVEQYLDAHGDMTWSADFLADDWTRINNSEVARRAISRIEARGRGILLLHDIHARTVLALPEILNELKSRGYKIVHVVPAAATGRKPQPPRSNG